MIKNSNLENGLFEQIKEQFSKDVIESALRLLDIDTDSCEITADHIDIIMEEISFKKIFTEVIETLEAFTSTDFSEVGLTMEKLLALFFEESKKAGMKEDFISKLIKKTKSLLNKTFSANGLCEINIIEYDEGDDHHVIPDFEGRYRKENLDDFIHVLYEQEHGECMRDVSEANPYGAWGPCQIMWGNQLSWSGQRSFYLDKLDPTDRARFLDIERIHGEQGSYKKLINYRGNNLNKEALELLMKTGLLTNCDKQKSMCKEKVEEYFGRYEDWGKVAAAWYCGPSYADSLGRGCTASSPYPSGVEYVAKIMKKLKRRIGIVSSGSALELSLRKNITINLVKKANLLDLQKNFKKADKIDNLLMRLINS